jgi:hypothetical protein
VSVLPTDLHVLKGHGFSRAANGTKQTRALKGVHDHRPASLKNRTPQPAHCEPISLLEGYIFETIIARMLVAMTAKQRHEFLTRRVQLQRFRFCSL